VDLERLAEHLGVTEIAKQEMDAEGFVEQLHDGHFKICLRTNRSEQRTRFSLAHELAHIILHKLTDSSEATLARQYRKFCAVETDINTESIADAIAGILLIPPHEISRRLPERFSLKRIVELAHGCGASVATSMIRAGWYATQPVVLFHLRRFRRSSNSTPKVMWASASRSLAKFSPQSAASLLDMQWIEATLHRTLSAYGVAEREEGLHRLEIYRSTYFERESVYGILFLRDEKVRELISLTGISETDVIADLED
jgi:hypothetical protein